MIGRWLELDQENRRLTKNVLLSQLFALDSISHAIEVMKVDYDSVDRKNLTLLHLGLGLTGHANAEIDSLLERHPSDSLFANWTKEYGLMLESGYTLNDFGIEDLNTFFFQHMDSTQEGQMDGFWAAARDSVFLYELEREGRRTNQMHEGNDYDSRDLVLYPNPVSQILNIEFSDTKGTLIVTDLLGVVKYRKHDFDSFDTLSTDDFSNGVYIVVIIDSTGQRSSSRFVVLK